MLRTHPVPQGWVSEQTRVGLFTAAAFAAFGVLTAFFPLWLADRGLSAAEIGQVLGLGPLLRVLAVPAWGQAADRFGRTPMLLLASVVAATAAASLPLSAGFLPILVIVALQGVASSALTPLTDATTIALARAKRLDYGRARAWGSVAYMAATALAGPVVQWAGSMIVPIMVATGYGVAAVFSRLLPQVAAAPMNGRIARRVDRGLLRLAAFRMTALASGLIQGSHAAYYGFAPLHWRGAGISDTAISLLIAEGIIAEIALFVWGRRLAERLGPAGLTGVAAACCLVRWTGTALTTDIWLLVPLQLLHGGSFAFQHLSTMQMLSQSIPPHRAGTAQALMSVLGGSLPMGVLLWGCGQIYGQAGGATFLAMAAIGGSALALVPSLARISPSARAPAR